MKTPEPEVSMPFLSLLAMLACGSPAAAPESPSSLPAPGTSTTLSPSAAQLVRQRDLSKIPIAPEDVGTELEKRRADGMRKTAREQYDALRLRLAEVEKNMTPEQVEVVAPVFKEIREELDAVGAELDNPTGDGQALGGKLVELHHRADVAVGSMLPFLQKIGRPSAEVMKWVEELEAQQAEAP